MSFELSKEYERFHRVANGNLDLVLEMMLERFPTIAEYELREIVLELSGEY